VPNDHLQVDGLAESIKALAYIERDLGNAARGALRDAAKVVQFDAQRRISGRPGGGSYPRRRGMVGRSGTNKGAAVKLRGSKYPWAWGAEYGAKRAWVFGRVTTQGQLRRRQFPVWRGNQFVVRGRGGPGWAIQPAIRRNLPRVTADIEEALGELVREAFRRQGERLNA
jgi:hypothetical protein